MNLNELKLLTFDKVSELEAKFKLAKEPVKWIRNETIYQVGSYVSYIGYVFLVDQDLGENTFDPFHSNRFLMTEHSAHRSILEALRMEEAHIKTEPYRVEVGFINEDEKFTMLAFGDNTYARSDLGGTSDTSLRAAFIGLCSPKKSEKKKKLMSSGEESTLGNWLKMSSAFFGKDSKATLHLKDLIAHSEIGEDEEVISDEGQLIHALGQIHIAKN